MSKIVVAVFLIFAGAMYSPAQDGGDRKAVLAYRVADGERWGFRFDENPLFDYDADLRRPETRVAIRFCSKSSLEKVLESSQRQVDVVRNFLEQAYDFTQDRFLVLRADGCHNGSAVTSAIELWVIPKGAEVPAATETLKGCKSAKDGGSK